MNKIKQMILIIVLFFCAHTTFSQEVAPKRTIEYSISINHLKTQKQADNIVQKIEQIKGINNCSLILTEYTIVFECTNYDMQTYSIMDIVKQIIIEEGAGITIINQKTIKNNETDK